jgi:hypothetical protein
MRTRSNRTLQLLVPFAVLLATILVVGFAVAPSEFRYQAWPTPPSGSAVDQIVGLPAPESGGMPLADVSPRRNAAGGTIASLPARPGSGSRVRHGLVRHESSAQRARRARPRGRGSRPARPVRPPVEPDRSPAQSPAPADPPAQAGGDDGTFVAELPAPQPTLRPSEPETPVQAPAPTVTVDRRDDSGDSGESRNGNGYGRGHGYDRDRGDRRGYGHRSHGHSD